MNVAAAVPLRAAPETILPLTSLRFFAAFAVVLFHAWAFHWLPPDFFGQGAPWHAVSFFFILSGFILQYNYRDRVELLGPARIIALRIARIWPLHVAVIVGVILLLPGDFAAAINYLPPRIVASVILLLQSWDPHPSSYFAINSPAWTLSDELFFYVCFPWLCLAARRAPVILVGATLAGLALYLFIVGLIPNSRQTMPGLYVALPLVRLPEFVFGLVLCELSRHIARWRGKMLFWTGLEIAALASVITLNSNVMGTHGWLLRNGWESLASYFAETGTAPSFLALILVFSMNRGSLSRLLSFRALVYLGEISFAVYLIHQPIERFLEEWHLIADPVLRVTVVAVAVIALAALAFHWVERPANRLARRKLMPARRGAHLPPVAQAAAASASQVP